jgi:hypothetical protein
MKKRNIENRPLFKKLQHLYCSTGRPRSAKISFFVKPNLDISKVGRTRSAAAAEYNLNFKSVFLYLY